MVGFPSGPDIPPLGLQELNSAEISTSEVPQISLKEPRLLFSLKLQNFSSPVASSARWHTAAKRRSYLVLSGSRSALTSIKNEKPSITPCPQIYIFKDLITTCVCAEGGSKVPSAAKLPEGWHWKIQLRKLHLHSLLGGGREEPSAGDSVMP